MAKRKTNWLPLMIIIVLLLMMKSPKKQVPSVECGTNPTGECIVRSSTTFAPGVNLNLADNEGDGAIAIGANGVTLDCNGGTINGGSSNSIGILVGSYQGVTIRNCNIVGYNQGILFSAGASSNVLQFNELRQCTTNCLDIRGSYHDISNNNFVDSSRDYMLNFVGVSNTRFANNYLDNTAAIRLRSGTNGMQIEGNTFINHFDMNYPLIQVESSSNNIDIRGNTFGPSSSFVSVKYVPNSNVRIYDNTFYGQQYIDSIRIIASSGVTITNNDIDGGSIGVAVMDGSSNVDIVGNTLTNQISNADSWNIGVYVSYNNDDILIENNLIDNYGSAGIVIRQTDNVVIRGNTINQMSNSNKLANGEEDQFMPTFAIGIVELYLSYVGDGTDDQYTDDYSKVSTYDNYGAIIENNNFGPYVQTYLYLQGAYGVTHDITNYWYRSFRAPVYLVDREEYFNNLAYDELTYISHEGIESNVFLVGYDINTYLYKQKFNMQMSKTSMSFEGVNSIPYEDYTYDLTLYELNQAAPYNDVFDPNSGTLLASNVDTYSRRVLPGQKIEISNYGSSSITYNDFLSYKNNYVNGGTMSLLVSNANNWVNG